MIDPYIKLNIITKKPVYPSDEEMANNSRSKSAKMRVGRKVINMKIALIAHDKKRQT